jgi:hypothetical protein
MAWSRNGILIINAPILYRGFFLLNIFICDIIVTNLGKKLIKLMDILFENIETVRDRRGSVIGFIKKESGGKQVFRDKTGKLLGFYMPKLNQTRDHNGSLVGKGNLLTSLATFYK